METIIIILFSFCAGFVITGVMYQAGFSFPFAIITCAVVGACIGFVGTQFANAYTTTMTASVRYNNCNLLTSHMPPPEIISIHPNEYGYNFIALVGSSTLFSIWQNEYTLNFYLDDAKWSIINSKAIMGECVL